MTSYFPEDVDSLAYVETKNRPRPYVTVNNMFSHCTRCRPNRVGSLRDFFLWAKRRECENVKNSSDMSCSQVAVHGQRSVHELHNMDHEFLRSLLSRDETQYQRQKARNQIRFWWSTVINLVQNVNRKSGLKYWSPSLGQAWALNSCHSEVNMDTVRWVPGLQILSSFDPNQSCQCGTKVYRSKMRKYCNWNCHAARWSLEFLDLDHSTASQWFESAGHSNCQTLFAIFCLLQSTSFLS